MVAKTLAEGDGAGVMPMDKNGASASQVLNRLLTPLVQSVSVSRLNQYVMNISLVQKSTCINLKGNF